MPDITINHSYTLTVPEYGTHQDIDELVSLVKRSGSHFFDPDTMRFFRSRVDHWTFAGPDGWYFVTSEQHNHSRGTEPRKYTVRRLCIADNDISLDELEAFQHYPTLTRARMAARNAAKTGVPFCARCRCRLTPDELCAECVAREHRS